MNQTVILPSYCDIKYIACIHLLLLYKLHVGLFSSAYKYSIQFIPHSRGYARVL